MGINTKKRTTLYILFILLLANIATGCTINQKHLANAESICSDHGGICEIYRDFGYADGYCKDGTFFDDISGNVQIGNPL